MRICNLKFLSCFNRSSISQRAEVTTFLFTNRIRIKLPKNKKSDLGFLILIYCRRSHIFKKVNLQAEFLQKILN